MDDRCGLNVNAYDSVHEKKKSFINRKADWSFAIQTSNLRNYSKKTLIFNYLKILYGWQVGHYPEPWLIHVYVQPLGYDQPKLGGPEH